MHINRSTKQQAIPKQLQIVLKNVCQTLGLCPQTLHTTIQLVHNPRVQKLKISPTLLIACLFLSHKVHETQPISISQFCHLSNTQVTDVIEMELCVLLIVQFRIGANRLLVTQAFNIAWNWDQFCRCLTCLNVRFYTYQSNSVAINSNQSCYVNNNNNSAHSYYNNSKRDSRYTSKHSATNISSSSIFQQYTGLGCSELQMAYSAPTPNNFAYKLLIQTCEKLAYRTQTLKFDQTKIALALVVFVIKSTQRYEEHARWTRNQRVLGVQEAYRISQFEINNKQNIHRQSQKEQEQQQQVCFKNTISPLFRTSRPPQNYKSTQIIISDFIRQNYNMTYGEIKQNCGGLKDITNTFKINRTLDNPNQVKIRQRNLNKVNQNQSTIQKYNNYMQNTKIKPKSLKKQIYKDVGQKYKKIRTKNIKIQQILSLSNSHR